MAALLRIACAPGVTRISRDVYSDKADIGGPRVLRYSDEDQQRLFPGDRGLEHAANANRPLPWGHLQENDGHGSEG